MLTECMPRIALATEMLMDNDLGLVESFLNPVLFDSGLVDHDNDASDPKGAPDVHPRRGQPPPSCVA